MKKKGWADSPFSFHDSEELGPAILAKVAKKTGLQLSGRSEIVRGMHPPVIGWRHAETLRPQDEFGCCSHGPIRP